MQLIFIMRQQYDKYVKISSYKVFSALFNDAKITLYRCQMQKYCEMKFTSVSIVFKLECSTSRDECRKRVSFVLYCVRAMQRNCNNAFTHIIIT